MNVQNTWLEPPGAHPHVWLALACAECEPLMCKEKSKSKLDEDLDEALKETFPGSDPIAVYRTDDKVIRPMDRRPPVINKQLVEELAQKAKQRRKL
jgi:hypothetical protein